MTRPPAKASDDRLFPLGLVTLLTALALLVHGYHPYSEDGGLYVAGIKHLLDPTLYPHSLLFVEAHLRYSVFAPLVATLVRTTRLSLPTVLLTLHLASIWATLYAAWLLIAHGFPSRAARAGATTLLAATLTVPVAGTSLILMDPYLTARSLSLPCTLLALVALLNLHRAATPRQRTRAALLCCLWLLLAAAVHPLMAAYGMGDVFLLAALLSPRRSVRLWGTTALCALALVLAAALHTTAPPETPAYLEVAITRYYWFLSKWQWFEVLGLAAPLLILAAVAVPRPSNHLLSRALARTAIASGTTAIVIALAFAHERGATHLVARLQPLRTFQVVYVVMLLMLGAWLGQHLLHQSLGRWAATFTLLGGLMFFVQRSTYPGSNHIEWPGTTPTNPWVQAFLWIAANSPKDALFALDANYTSRPSEDAQGFRALAERSALPDYSKDGGEASITPSLTDAWKAGQTAQTHLSEATDAQRLARLHPLHADWIVLLQTAPTSFDCPYSNPLVKVCRLP